MFASSSLRIEAPPPKKRKQWKSIYIIQTLRMKSTNGFAFKKHCKVRPR
jgi:hypothetical protein